MTLVSLIMAMLIDSSFIFIQQASEDHLRAHYADLSHLPFFPGLVKHMASGPVVAMVSGCRIVHNYLIHIDSLSQNAL